MADPLLFDCCVVYGNDEGVCGSYFVGMILLPLECEVWESLHSKVSCVCRGFCEVCNWGFYSFS